MTNSERASYIRGLMEGLELDPKAKETKVLNAMVELLDDLCISVEELEDGFDLLSEQVDEIDEDLGNVEEDFYELDGGCSCHHHHHHADEVFASWGKETPKIFTRADIEAILTALDSGEYGQILRCKGIVNGGEEGWLEFDMVPAEHEIRTGKADYTGRLCVIGSELKEAELEKLFLLV